MFFRGSARTVCPNPIAPSNGEERTMGLDSGALIKKLNKTCLDALDAAAGLCLSRTNSSVEIEHWLLKLAEAPDTDLNRLFRYFEIDPSRLQRDLVHSIDQLKTGNARTPSLSTLIDHLIREAWVLASSSIRRPGSAPGCSCWRCCPMRSSVVWLARRRASSPRSPSMRSSPTS